MWANDMKINPALTIATEATQDDTCMAERVLWKSVIQYHFYKCSVGDSGAFNFFQYSNHFKMLCRLIGLSEDRIRQRAAERFYDATKEQPGLDGERHEQRAD
jgi:hypothetical protein